MSLIPDNDFGARVRTRLKDELILWLTTVGKDGTPQPNPVWFLWEPDTESLLVYNRTDAVRLRQVVDGLLEIALRISPAGSRIHLALSANETAVQLSISDGGPGLTPADAADAFERGRLHERYRAVRPVGTGLGLSIAARLVERMGGTITAHSHSHPGAGAEFRIRLPR
jgi:PPOX class probable F420-dependent enzyme